MALETINTKASFYLDTRRKIKDGSYPLKIRISHNGGVFFVSTSYYFTYNEWESVLAARRTGGRIVPDGQMAFSALEKINSLIADIKLRDDYPLMTLLDIKTIINNKRSHLEEQLKEAKRNRYTFPAYTRELMEEIENEGNRKVYEVTLHKIEAFERFYNREPEALRFTDMTPAWLSEFDSWMSIPHVLNKGTQNEIIIPANKVNSRAQKMRTIRAIINEAIDNGIETNYPFSRTSGHRKKNNNGVRKFRIIHEKTAKEHLSLADLIRLRDFPCEPYQVIYRDMFMLMFYLIGINAGDLFLAKPEQYTKGRLNYIRRKTGRKYSIKVEPEAEEIITRYRGKNHLLSPCDDYKSYSDFLHHMNDALKSIGMVYKIGMKKSGNPAFPGLTSNWARHTWATICVNEADVQKEIVGLAMGHSWAENTTTDIYVEYDEKKIDTANRKVLDLLL